MSLNLPLLFFLLLIPLSGFIAWAGDRVGHKVGKRRHSLFGLRPRHTAILFTVASGMLIALATFTLMWLSDARFRVLLRDGAQLLENNRRLRTTNKTLEQAIGDSRRAADLARTAANQAKKEQQSAQKERLAAESDVQKATSELKSAHSDLQTAQTNLGTTRAELRQKEQRVEEASRRLTDVRARLETVRLAEEKARARAVAAETRAGEAETRAATIEKSAEEAVALLNQNYDRLAAQKQEADEKRRELEDLTTRLETARRQASLLLVESLRYTTDFRNRPITFEVGEEIVRKSFSKEIKTADAQKQLFQLLSEAAEQAVRRGAARRDRERAAFILTKAVSDGAPDSGGTQRVDEADSVGAAADAILRADSDVAVLVVAAANTVEGEPVPVEFRTYRNPVILQKNELLGTATLDGTQNRQAIADDLYAFLRRDIRRRLLRAGVIPPQKANRPQEASDLVVETADSIVSISGEQWLNVLQAVQSAGPAAHVEIRVPTDLRAADSIRLDFRVTPLSPLPDKSPAAAERSPVSDTRDSAAAPRD